MHTKYIKPSDIWHVSIYYHMEQKFYMDLELPLNFCAIQYVIVNM